MAIAMLLSAALATQVAAQSTAQESSMQQRDAAYEQLAAGETEAAIVRLEAALVQTPGDPALLINLGTAYTRAGRMEEARTAFRAAMESNDRYSVELADGRWEDSRKVARLALDSLDRSTFATK
jgi:cytochrome c-type biogenesis protein CcmH/NrfG